MTLREIRRFQTSTDLMINCKLILKNKTFGWQRQAFIRTDPMKSLAKDESLSLSTKSSVFENQLTGYHNVSTEWEIYTNLLRSWSISYPLHNQYGKLPKSNEVDCASGDCPPCPPRGCGGLCGQSVWRCKLVCHTCKKGDDNAKGYPTGTQNLGDTVKYL